MVERGLIELTSLISRETQFNNGDTAQKAIQHDLLLEAESLAQTVHEKCK